MPILPSGRHWCIDDAPLKKLLQDLHLNGLRLPELLVISWPFELRRYLRIMWLLPIGADSRPKTSSDQLYETEVDGLSMVDSGHTLACLPDDLNELDRAAVKVFWRSDPCYQFVNERMELVEQAQNKILLSDAPEERLLAKWFARETASTNRSVEAKILGLMIENGMIPNPQNNSLPSANIQPTEWQCSCPFHSFTHSRLLAQLQPLLSSTVNPVILLEGTRQLPSEQRQALADMGRCLAETFPLAVFRSGNATGTDEAFATGVATVPGSKLQLVLPTPGMGRSRRPASATCLALDDLPLEERHHLARESLSASPENHRLFDLYLRGQSGNPAYAKAQYLVRDALKVFGSPALQLAPATVALFFINNTGPTSGGTAHTIRLCERQKVPVFTQQDWLE
jgi:hypothetical protein